MRRLRSAVRVGLGLGLLIALAIPAAAQVQPPVQPPAAVPSQLVPLADPFQSRVERAAQLMDTDPQAALEAIDHLAVESIELRRTRPLAPAERTSHRQLFILRARGHLQAMNNDKVDESLRELLRVDPFFNQALTPREQEVLDAIRTRESGLLEVSSAVRDCKVLVDGIEIGVTGDVPVRASLVNGTYYLRLEKPGFQAAGATLTIAAAQTLSVTDLAPKAQIPPIAFLSDRAGVEVLVDNAHAGETMRVPALRERLSAEEASALDQAMSLARFDPATSAGFLLRDPPVDRSVSVRFRGECLVEETRTISITADALAKLDAASPLLWFGDGSTVRMRPDVGMLRVTSSPTDADVYVDGQMVGRSPFERQVCVGDHRVRIRHRIGSYIVMVSVVRGRTETVDAVLKPGLAFLGAVETVQGALHPAPDLMSAIDRALSSVVKSFRLAPPVDIPPEVQRWTDTSTAELIAAADRGDSDAVKRWLRTAADNYDAPLLMTAVARGPASDAATAVDLMLFWIDHPGVDRVRVQRMSPEGLNQVLKQIENPADPARLVFANDLGMRVADSLLPDASLVVVSVEPGSPAALGGIRPGDGIASVDGSPVTASQVADRVAEKRPGDLLAIQLSGSQGKQVAVPVQRRPRRAPVFDPTLFGNVVIAKLVAASAAAGNSSDRELIAFSLALARMRFGQWREALDQLGNLGQLPSGLGVSQAAATYFRARCHLELGERDRALSLLREAASADSQVLADDGATVGALVKLRLGSLGEAPRPPAVR
jgi:membrane-associated protease RseP (regulator of RpoE activity)